MKAPTATMFLIKSSLLIFSLCLHSTGCNPDNVGAQTNKQRGQSRSDSGTEKSPMNDETSDSNGTEQQINSGTNSANDASAQGNVDTVTPASKDQCLVKKADQYNVIIVLDNSNSQSWSDPTDMRAIAAKTFIGNLSEQVKKNEKLQISVAVVSFNSTATVTKSWAQVSNENAESFNEGITLATNKPAGATQYTPPLTTAINLLDEKKASIDHDRERNYVIFLADGNPTDNKNAISSAIDTLVKNYGVAIFAIASEYDAALCPPILPTQNCVLDKNQLEALALPKEGIKHASHKGMFSSSSAPEKLEGVFNDLFEKIAECE